MLIGRAPILAISAVAAALSIPVRAQTKPPSFEAVSVRPSGTNQIVSYGPSAPVAIHTRAFAYSGRRVTCDLSLREIVQEAFSVRDFQVIGPEWIASNTYDLAAVLPEGATKDDARLMLRTMLQERFGLRYRLAKADLPVYALIPSKAGFRLKPVDPEAQKERLVETRFGPRKGVSLIQARGQFTALAISMDDFARHLSNVVDLPVVNQTAIDGTYEIDLRWTPEPNGRSDPELFRTIERTAGLKLERRKAPCETVVIERVEKTPTAN